MSDEFTAMLKRLKTSLSQEVSELLLLESDLVYAIKGFKLFGSIKDNGSEDIQHLITSLFRDSLITLVSCFDNSTPHNLDPKKVFSEQDKSLEYFSRLENLRNLWVAHRFGPQRYAVFGFLIHPDSGEIVGDGPFVGVFTHDNQDESQQLVRFTEVALNYVRSILSEKIPKLQAECANLYPNQRLELPDAECAAPDHLKHRMGRKKYQNLRAAGLGSNEYKSDG